MHHHKEPGPMRSWLWAVNVLMLQWLCMRLMRVLCTDTGRTVGWRLLVGVAPLTGWRGPYHYLPWWRVVRL